MNMLDTIVEISNKYGSNPDLVLAGGGNTSCKDAESLYIKGSGTTLKTITADGFVKMRRDRLLEMRTKKYSNDMKSREDEVLADLMDARDKCSLAKRPSVETILHDLFPAAYVVHTHPALVNGLSCSQNGKDECARLFGGKVLWIGLVEPGYVLALEVMNAMKGYKAEYGCDADIVILQNHGIFVSGNSPEEIDGKYAFVLDMLNKAVAEKPDFSSVQFDSERAALLAPAVRMLTGGGIAVFHTNAAALVFLQSADDFAAVSSAYTPDHMVYYKRAPLFVPFEDDMEKQYDVLEAAVRGFEGQHGFLPHIVAIERLGFFAAAPTKKQADVKIQLFNDTIKIATYAKSFGGGLFMTEYLIDFIANWEAESYRQGVSAAASNKRLQEKITIVTGSAQGFGLGLAEELLNQGAYVVIADLNESLAQKEAARLAELHGVGGVFALPVNVGDEESVKNLVYQTVLCYGGLDVFVSNAGVLKAGALEEMTISDFEFVTKINYTAFFTCTKYASRIMKIQHRFDPEKSMDIVQINSKSGLSGSNKNFAYAGGKFGGIGLVQSFALELTPYNIKVNAICPGNLLSGPLWTDPQRGLFVQYLNAGKVPGAKTIDDVRRFYEAKVPMNRGCEIIDVARALFYVIEQQYETGQAIPVTGGQNMLK